MECVGLSFLGIAFVSEPLVEHNTVPSWRIGAIPFKTSFVDS